MKQFLITVLVLFSTTLYSQNSNTEKYHRAKIYYNSEQELNNLSALGLALDHGFHKDGLFVESDFPQSQIEAAKNMGTKVEILIWDVQQFYLDQNDPKNSRYIAPVNTIINESCDGVPPTDYETPVNYNNGSMGGFLTYTEMLQELDDMKALYPNLITARTSISSFRTEEGRGIQHVKISDNPNSNESASESQVLYSAIHHAREAASLQQTIFYMWYLLENYETNDEIKSILNNSELYFVPCINPDGYIYNETTNPNGGGLWRKNRSRNGGSRGVDLNRNYSYITPNGNEVWNTAGTSGPNGDTYAGTRPFSEPETQAMRWLVEQNNFKVALNAHSFSELLLFPFGYADNRPTPENDIFKAVSEYMVGDNNYNNIISADLYPAAGDSDDFMYGMLTTANGGTRDKVYAMTPEIGDSFWPAESQVISVCKEMLFLNIAAAQVAGNSAKIKDNSPSIFIESTASMINYEIERIGFEQPANFTVFIEPVSPNILSVGQPQNQNNMDLSEKRTGDITINLNSTITQGEDVIFDIVVNNGLYDKKTRVYKKYGTAVPILDEPGNDTTTNWESTNWGISTTVYNSESSSITDSPNGEYSDNENNTIELANPLDLTSAVNANLSYYARWDIENNYDYVQIEVSTNNGNTWTPQCGKYTNTGVGNQNGANGEPLYDGTQNEWVLEEISLSDYIGSTIKIRFKLISDGGVTGDGFYYDDLKVKVIDTSLSTPDYIDTNFSIFPNPVAKTLQINSSLSNYKYKIYNIQGQLIKQKDSNNNLTKIDCSHLAAGMYLLNIENNSNEKTYKIIKK